MHEIQAYMVRTYPGKHTGGPRALFYALPTENEFEKGRTIRIENPRRDREEKHVHAIAWPGLYMVELLKRPPQRRSE